MNKVTLPRELTDIMAEAIAKEANCCGGIAHSIYEAIVAAAPNDCGWISVDERMPPHDEEVIVYADGFVSGGYTYSKYSGHFLDASYDSLRGVTHWMPLPEGPKK